MIRTLEYQTVTGFIEWLNSKESIPDPITVVADYQHENIWRGIELALALAHEHHPEWQLDRIHLKFIRDEANKGWYII